MLSYRHRLRVITLLVMKLFSVVAAMACACTGSSSAIMPDAPLVGVHDQLASEQCDLSWGADAVGCEHACLMKPTELPCHGAVPCDDHAACAAGNGRLRVDCASTFSVEDWQGTHVGCCMVRSVIANPKPLEVPTFYECLAPR